MATGHLSLFYVKFMIKNDQVSTKIHKMGLQCK